MRSFTIQKNDSEQRLDKFLTKAVPLLPQGLLYKYIRLKRIKVNGKRTEISYRLAIGDLVELYINDEFFESVAATEKPAFLSAPADVEIVYEDDNLLLVNKPAGLVVHEDESGSVDTLISRVLRYLYEKEIYDPAKEQSFIPALCNRIDRNTSGIVICAKNAATLRVMNDKIKNREINKYYQCLVFGCPQPHHKVLKAYMVKDSATNQVRVFDKPIKDGRTMITEYTVIETNKAYSLLDIQLHTGRTHQIRAHLAYVGHPLLGDTKYGTNQQNKGLPYRYQALCSYKLTFAFTTPAEHLDYLQGKTFALSKIPFSLPGI
ncbi:MAG: RluA family pseudouridine synthase [Angelakisella sp.]|nr:RluA family pseudouridine synthase [Angelakisella sp.]